MHMIEAVVKPHAVEKIKAELTALSVFGCTATECKGYGRQKGHTERYRGGETQVGFVPKVRLQIAVLGDSLEAALSAVRKAANEGHVGDGKIFVYSLTGVQRVRTGERDDEAL